MHEKKNEIVAVAPGAGVPQEFEVSYDLENAENLLIGLEALEQRFIMYVHEVPAQGEESMGLYLVSELRRDLSKYVRETLRQYEV